MIFKLVLYLVEHGPVVVLVLVELVAGMHETLSVSNVGVSHSQSLVGGLSACCEKQPLCDYFHYKQTFKKIINHP